MKVKGRGGAGLFSLKVSKQTKLKRNLKCLNLGEADRGGGGGGGFTYEIIEVTLSL